MNNVKVELVKKITCNLSADQWNLYTNKFERHEVERIADSLNSCFEELVNCEFSKNAAEEIMLNKLELYSNYGANDTEPRGVLEQLLEYIYGKD